MSDLDPKITELEARLERLVRSQIEFQVEVSSIRTELTRLRNPSVPQAPKASDVPRPTPEQERPRVIENAGTPIWPTTNVAPPAPAPTSQHAGQAQTKSSVEDYFNKHTENARSNVERFIGENLISKIGILILILGVGIGSKYAIDNNLISPLTRIAIGYAFGFGLLGIAAKLKTKYHNFSAVLLSGATAIMYFITYFAYATYQLIGQSTAFPLMVALTAFTVAAAVLYNRQVIAHVGLVGAYAVPFLLSSDSGQYAFLFGYMGLINVGVLAVSLKKYWKPIFYTASAFTWLIFGVWFGDKYDYSQHFYLALTVLGVFVLIFHATKLVHGHLHPERDRTENIGGILGTWGIFYGFCLAIGDVRAGIFEYTVFFSYVGAAAIILLISSRLFFGRQIAYLSYPFNWLIFGIWFLRYYSADEHFALAAGFAAIFFAIFYLGTLVYSLAFDDLEKPLAVGLLLTNSFIFYGFTAAIADSRESTRGFEGLLTVAHAALHGVASQIVARLKQDSTLVVQSLTVLVLTFSTIAIPIQFDGNIVTIVWAVEAAALFGIGRLRRISLFEYFCYPLMVLASLSLAVDWLTAYFDRVPYPSDLNRVPFGNGDFITAIVFIGAATAIFVLNRDEKYEPPFATETARSIGYAVAAAGLFVLYNAFRIEISNYHHRWLVSAAQLASDSGVDANNINRDIGYVNILSQLIYTMAFFAALTAVNLRKSHSRTIAFASALLSSAALAFLVTAGMVLMYELRVSYMTGTPGTGVNILIRYATYLAAALMLWAGRENARDDLITGKMGTVASMLAFEFALTSSLFITLSCELVNLIAQFTVADGTKLGLSILWGVFALAMIVVGIAFDKTHQRITAFALLAVTLVKLFFYDISDLGTIPKTILFISLGTLLLIVSFLYNKYKNLIFPALPAESEARDDI